MTSEKTWKHLLTSKFLEMKTVKVKNIFLGLLAIVALSAMLVSCEQNALEDLTPNTQTQVAELEDRSNLSTNIVGTWWHSHEEDTNPTVENIYRPDTFNFPASRGRNGFEFLPNGDFVYFYPGPTDQQMQSVGRWRTFGNQNILIFFQPSINGPQFQRLSRIKVISINSNQLVIEPLNW